MASATDASMPARDMDAEIRNRNELLDRKVFEKYCALTCMKKSHKLLRRISRPRAEVRATIRDTLKKSTGG